MKIRIKNPEHYKRGYLYTDVRKKGTWRVKEIEALHTGFSSPAYYLHLEEINTNIFGKIFNRLIKQKGVRYENQNA